MSAAVMIDGKRAAADVLVDVQAALARLAAISLKPALTVVLVGDDPASEIYVRNKIAKCRELGLSSELVRLPAASTSDELLGRIRDLNADTGVHGILVQMPLPGHIDSTAVIAAIDPDKDVDGFHPHNVARLVLGQPGLRPCTPSACIYLLKKTLAGLAGLHAVVIGRSNIVGKPVASMLLQENCSVTIVHSRSRYIREICASADIVVAAVGRARMVDASWIRAGAMVLDVGINRVADGTATRIVGDVDTADVAGKAGYLTPVPGGVGPMTVAFLMRNTVIAACLQAGIAHDKLLP